MLEVVVELVLQAVWHKRYKDGYRRTASFLGAGTVIPNSVALLLSVEIRRSWIPLAFRPVSFRTDPRATNTKS